MGPGSHAESRLTLPWPRRPVETSQHKKGGRHGAAAPGPCRSRPAADGYIVEDMAQRFLFVAVIVAVLFGAAVSLAGATRPACVDGDYRLRGGPGIDQIRGYAGDDTLDGGGAPDGLFGNAGADRLYTGGVGRTTSSAGTVWTAWTAGHPWTGPTGRWAVQ